MAFVIKRTFLLWMLPITGVLLGLWGLVHQINTLTDPKWTESDIPTPPTESNNAWMVMKEPDLDIGALNNYLDEELETSDENSIKQLQTKAQKYKQKIEEAISHNKYLLEKINQYPRFVEASDIADPKAQPYAIETLNIWRLRQLQIVLDSKLNPDKAFKDSILYWQHSYDYALNCRSLLSCMIGPQLLDYAIKCFDLLITQHPKNPSTSSLKQQLRESDLTKLSAKSGIISEYILFYHILKEMPPTFLFAPGNTETLARTHYAKALIYINGDRDDKPEYTRYNRGWTIWLSYNPIGKIVLDVMLISFETNIDDFQESVTQLIEQKQNIITRNLN